MGSGFGWRGGWIGDMGPRAGQISCQTKIQSLYPKALVQSWGLTGHGRVDIIFGKEILSSIVGLGWSGGRCLDESRRGVGRK